MACGWGENKVTEHGFEVLGDPAAKVGVRSGRICRIDLDLNGQ